MTSRTDIAARIASYGNWAQDIDICGFHTLDPNVQKQYAHINRTRHRRDLFVEPLLRSGWLRGKRVLDLACRYGYWSMVAATEGGASHVLGVDANERWIEQGRWLFETKGVPNCELRVADAYETLAGLAERSFDVVFCLGYFYHIRDPYRLLALMRWVARDFVVVDTMVHNSEEALFSVRPVLPDDLLPQSVLGLELFSSPKALYWLALEAGYAAAGTLTADLGTDRAGLWDYRSGERASFALASRPVLEEAFDNWAPFAYPTPAEDLERHSLQSEVHGGRDAVAAERSG